LFRSKADLAVAQVAGLKTDLLMLFARHPRQHAAGAGEQPLPQLSRGTEAGTVLHDQEDVVYIASVVQRRNLLLDDAVQLNQRNVRHHGRSRETYGQALLQRRGCRPCLQRLNEETMQLRLRGRQLQPQHIRNEGWIEHEARIQLMIERADIRRERHDLLVCVQRSTQGLDALVTPVAERLQVRLKRAQRERVDAFLVLRAPQSVAIGTVGQLVIEQMANLQHPEGGQHMKVQAALGHHSKFGLWLLRRLLRS